MSNEKALISRRYFDIDQGRVCIEEVWDLKHPECPFIHNPWLGAIGQCDPVSGRHVRQVVMSNEEFVHTFPLARSGQISV